MAYSFTANINPYVAASIYEALNKIYPVNRQSFTAYALGTQVVNAGNIYVCTNSGTTGSGAGPMHLSGTGLDGSVTWLFLSRAGTIEGAINSNLYLTLGRQTEWDDPGTPDAPDTTPDGQEQALNDATVLLLLRANDIRLGIAKNDWTTGVAYSQYDSAVDQNSYPTPHYVIVDNTFVYVCIDNNNGANSTSAPSGTLANLIETADGYIWKYVGSITNSDIFQFGTTNYSPVPRNPDADFVAGQISTFNELLVTNTDFDEADDILVEVVTSSLGTGATAVARTNVSGSDKTITGIYATTPGEGYSDDTFAIAFKDGVPGGGAELSATLAGGEVTDITIENGGEEYEASATIVIIGDGTGAAATATVLAGVVTNVVVTDEGTGYTWARAFVIPSEEGAVAKAVPAPGYGHGTNLSVELQTRAVLFSKTLSSALNNYIPTESDTVDGSYRQIGLVSGISSTTRNPDALLGRAHHQYNANPHGLVKYQDGGSVLYLNNIEAITHTTNQEEIIKIVLTIS